MEHIVTGCQNCPFNSNDREYGDACLHPSCDSGMYGRKLPEDPDNAYATITPDWCPLILEPITIIKQ